MMKEVGEAIQMTPHPATTAYYTEQRKREMIDFANTYARVPKLGHKIVSIDVAETIRHYPFVAFVQDNEEVILTEWFR